MGTIRDKTACSRTDGRFLSASATIACLERDFGPRTNSVFIRSGRIDHAAAIANLFSGRFQLVTVDQNDLLSLGLHLGRVGIQAKLPFKIIGKTYSRCNLGHAVDHAKVKFDGLSVDTDRQLLQQYVLTGSQDAFASLVRRDSDMVFKVCRRMLPTVQDAEDACQATFLVLVKKASGPWQESVANWLFTTARSVARNARRASERREQLERWAATSEVVPAIDRLSARELLTTVDEELERLPALYRETLVLYHLEELASGISSNCGHEFLHRKGRDIQQNQLSADRSDYQHSPHI
jgi:RNA polymerase sigma factor (sigma-70 family)